MMRDTLTGRGSARAHLLYYLCFLGIYVGLWAWSASHYTSFSLHSRAISNLGNPKRNPEGWWIFTAACLFASVAVLPHVLRMARRLPWGKAWFILMASTCLGLAGVGIVNETIFKPHVFVAALAFGSGALAILVSFIALGLSVLKKEGRVHLPGFLTVFGIVALLGIYVLSQIAIHGIKIPNPKLNFPEWLTFAMLMIWLSGLPWVAPARGRERG